MKNTARLASSQKTQVSKGFTLVELLVVIAIIAILAAIVVLIINPLELIRRSHDAARLSDMANLQQAINVAVQEATGSSATNVLCNGNPAPCQGNSSTGTRTANGTGWVTVNLSAQSSVSVPTLPIDPLNTTPYVYQYYSDGNTWKMTCVLESNHYKSMMSNDGGTNNNEYEVGSNLSLPI